MKPVLRRYGAAIPFRRAVSLPRQLRELAVSVNRDGLTVGALLADLGHPGLLLMCMISSVPFLLPVSIPGSSVPVGLLIVLIGIGLAAGRTPWLPYRLLTYRLSGRGWASALMKGARMTAWLDKRSAPSFANGEQDQAGAAEGGPATANSGGWIDRFHCLVLTLSGLMLLSPLPLPFSNTLPAWAVFLIAAGQIKRSTWIISGGYVMAAASAGYIGLIALLGKAGAEALFYLVGR